jgi:hypothetical protein
VLSYSHWTCIFCSNFKLSGLFFDVLWYIDLIFGIWLYLDELQFKLEFRSGRMTFDWVMAIELVFFVHQVNISKDVKKKSGQLKIWTKNTSSMAITQPKVIQPERNSSLNCNTSRYSHIPNIKSIYKGRRQKKVQKTYILMWRTDRRTEPKTIVPFCFRRYGTNKLPCICSMYDIDITVFSMKISYLASIQCLYWYHSVFHENKLPCICSMFILISQCFPWK